MTPPRASQHLTTPPPPDELRDQFPQMTFLAGATLFRSHSAKQGPWWFGCSLEGRFDLPDPAGTCYLAESEIVGLLEAWAGIRIIARPDVAARAISMLAVHRELTIADTTANTAIRFGITAEIATTIDYSLTQRWAAALHTAGYEGIRYWARHDLAHTHACVAVFDTAGDHTDSPVQRTDYVVAQTDSLANRHDLLTELQQTAGITAIDPPASLDLP